ncbi:hypothetical protein ACP275_01G106600 [Erythranthe tilingii]
MKTQCKISSALSQIPDTPSLSQHLLSPPSADAATNSTGGTKKDNKTAATTSQTTAASHPPEKATTTITTIPSPLHPIQPPQRRRGPWPIPLCGKSCPLGFVGFLAVAWLAVVVGAAGGVLEAYSME